MALFVGKVPRSMSTDELKTIFSKYGTITRLELKTDFGFVEYAEKREAEDAILGENGRDLVVEWAKNGGKRPNENECFNCGKEGHWAKDCQERGRGYRGYGRNRARSPRRDYGGRERRYPFR